MGACERWIPFRCKGENSLQRRILTSVGNLTDCMADRIIISEPNLLILQGSMRQVPGPKALTEIWENDPQTIWVFT